MTILSAMNRIIVKYGITSKRIPSDGEKTVFLQILPGTTGKKEAAAGKSQWQLAKIVKIVTIVTVYRKFFRIFVSCVSLSLAILSQKW